MYGPIHGMLMTLNLLSNGDVTAVQGRLCINDATSLTSLSWINEAHSFIIFLPCYLKCTTTIGDASKSGQDYIP